MPDDTGNLLTNAEFEDNTAYVGAKASGTASLAEDSSSGKAQAATPTPSPTPSPSVGSSSGSGLSAQLDELMAQDLTAGGEDEELAIGGFPDLPRRQNPLDTLMERTVAPQLATIMDDMEAGSKPRYFEGDEDDPAISMGTEEIARLQKRMVSAGVLKAEFALGVWDDISRDSYRKLLRHANARGQDVEQSIVQFQNANIRPEEQLPEFSPDTYLKPDYASLENTVKDVIDKELGREANAGDIKELTSRLQKHYRDEYEANVELARRQYERGVAEQTQTAMTPAETIVAQAEGTMPDQEAFDMGEIERVDPTARFMQEFDKRFEGEKAMVDRREQGEENRNLLQDGFSGLRRALAGGQA